MARLLIIYDESTHGPTDTLRYDVHGVVNGLGVLATRRKSTIERTRSRKSAAVANIQALKTAHGLTEGRRSRKPSRRDVDLANIQRIVSDLRRNEPMRPWWVNHRATAPFPWWRITDLSFELNHSPAQGKRRAGVYSNVNPNAHI